ncbi:MAG: YwiC-like family protein [Anaerolineae bacterium]|nr:YwiC-like family protein [Anaerolineae bacterium]
MTAQESVSTERRPNLRSVALPAEHGGWGFLIEPILLGLLVAFSVNGV